MERTEHQRVADNACPTQNHHVDDRLPSPVRRKQPSTRTVSRWNQQPIRQDPNGCADRVTHVVVSSLECSTRGSCASGCGACCAPPAGVHSLERAPQRQLSRGCGCSGDSGVAVGSHVESALADFSRKRLTKKDKAGEHDHPLEAILAFTAQGGLTGRPHWVYI